MRFAGSRRDNWSGDCGVRASPEGEAVGYIEGLHCARRSIKRFGCKSTCGLHMMLLVSSTRAVRPKDAGAR
jgi:hypothetical protein